MKTAKIKHQRIMKVLDVFHQDLLPETVRYLLEETAPAYTDNGFGTIEHLYDPAHIYCSVTDPKALETDLPSPEVINQIKELSDLADKHKCSYIMLTH